jgi:ribonucleoside-diphosphate reductase alpha chain
MTVEQWLNGNELSINIFNKKYKNGNETLDEFFDRISHGYEPIKKLIKEKKFLFGGRILANRGVKDRKLTYSNCYVINPPEDNIESIFKCASKLARTYSYGGGCGIDLSKLRPNGAFVSNAAKTTCGPVGFMDIFSQTTATIGQAGRRGALMISLDVNHPDIEEFIDCKTDLNRVCYANISVRVNDEFMNAVENDSDYILRWPCNDTSVDDLQKEWPCEAPYNELCETVANGEIVGYYKRVRAKELFNKLAKNNWDYAEPGILYWDRIEWYNLLNNTGFKYAGVNPCAEEPLPSGGSCLLGSINLSEFVKNPFTPNACLDFDELEQTVFIAVVGLNQVLIEGLNLHPLQEQRDSVKNWRQIGLGTMGLADMLIKMSLTYGSKESLKLIDEIYKCISTSAVIQSLELAKQYGCYPGCEKSKLTDSAFIKSLNLPQVVLNEIRIYGLYNSQLLTCAPTGSIATMFETSTGVEPNFALSYTRKTQSLDGKDTFYQVNTKIVEDFKTLYSQELPEFFITSESIDPINRVKVQSVLQKYTDASISSTVNLPNSSTVEDVYNIYMEAWKQGLKGITIYRSGCKREGVLTTEKPKEEENSAELKRGEIVKAGDDCIGLKRTLTTGCGTLHCTAYFDPQTGKLLETYLSKGSKGGCQNFMVGLSRMISLAARGGLPLEAILDQLKSCGTCPSYAVRSATKKDTSLGSCCPIAVGNALKDMYNEMQERLKNCMPINTNSIQLVAEHENTENLEECPECHHKTLIHSGGCIQCIDCGWSKCN